MSRSTFLPEGDALSGLLSRAGVNTQRVAPVRRAAPAVLPRPQPTASPAPPKAPLTAKTVSAPTGKSLVGDTLPGAPTAPSPLLTGSLEARCAALVQWLAPTSKTVFVSDGEGLPLMAHSTSDALLALVATQCQARRSAALLTGGLPDCGISIELADGNLLRIVWIDTSEGTYGVGWVPQARYDRTPEERLREMLLAAVAARPEREKGTE
ncbi:MAG: hypothetical protein R3B72_43335 [Polyangiaceae bacterium]